MLRKASLAAAAFVALIFAAASWAVAGGIPSIPSSPVWSEPSQILGTLNTFIRMLNGQATSINTTPGNLSLGSFCTGSTATSTVTCNGNRGSITYTYLGTLTQGSQGALTLTNSSIAASSACVFQVMRGGAAGSAPYVTQALPAAGSLGFNLTNGGSTATGLGAQVTIGFQCFQ